MEEAGGGEVRLSPSRLRDELRRLLSSDPLPARLPPGDGSPQGHRSAVLAGPMPKGEWALGPAAAERRREAGPDLRSHLSFWKRIAGIVIAVAVILLLTWITLNPPELPQLEPCPDDRLYCKKKCYYHSGATADWNSSQESCSDYRASLAAIDSRQELNFLMYRIRIPDFWIGLRRKGNKFFWVNGESFDANFHILCILQKLSKIGGKRWQGPTVYWRSTAAMGPAGILSHVLWRIVPFVLTTRCRL
ncbi:C-type lectin domain family 2 member L-like isoform 2-T2 [Theristicus caerulescens]